jgi:hypothetical protein
MRTLPVYLACIAILVALGLEIGARFLPVPAMPPDPAMFETLDDEDREAAQEQFARQSRDAERPPGLALPALALLDGLLAWTGFLFATATVMAQGWHSRLRAVAMLLVCLAVIAAAVLMVMAAIAKLTLMLSLLLAAPFGTIAYLAVFGGFNSGGVLAMLGAATLCRALFIGLLLVASWRYLENKTLMLLTGTGFLGGFLIGLVFAFLPGILHSIGDAVAAIVLAIMALVWAIVLLLRSLPGLIKLLRVDRLA